MSTSKMITQIKIFLKLIRLDRNYMICYRIIHFFSGLDYFLLYVVSIV